MSDKKLTICEERRLILGNHMMTSEVKLGRTIFDVTSKMGNEANSFKDIVKRVAEREIHCSDKDVG